MGRPPSVGRFEIVEQYMAPCYALEPPYESKNGKFTNKVHKATEDLQLMLKDKPLTEQIKYSRLRLPSRRLENISEYGHQLNVINGIRD